MTILKSLFVAGIAGIAFAAPAAAQQLTGQSFIDLHAGKCVSYSGESEGVQCYNADGTTRYDDTTYGSDTGNWEVRGNDVCEMFTQEPRWDCGPVMSLGAGQFSDGAYTWTIN